MAELTRMNVRRTFELEADSMFGGTIADMVGYLESMKAKHAPANAVVTIDQRWTGYEDNLFELVWDSPETDEEFESRKHQRRREIEREENLKAAQKVELERKRQDLIRQQREIAEQLKKLSGPST